VAFGSAIVCRLSTAFKLPTAFPTVPLRSDWNMESRREAAVLVGDNVHDVISATTMWDKGILFFDQKY